MTKTLIEDFQDDRLMAILKRYLAHRSASSGDGDHAKPPKNTGVPRIEGHANNRDDIPKNSTDIPPVYHEKIVLNLQLSVSVSGQFVFPGIRNKRQRPSRTLTANATKLLDCVRQRRGIENRCHRVIDVAFNEDRCRIRKDHAAHNFVTLRRFALNLLRLNQDMDNKKMSLRRRRKRAHRNDDYLMELISRIARPVSQRW